MTQSKIHAHGCRVSGCLVCLLFMQLTLWLCVRTYIHTIHSSPFWSFGRVTCVLCSVLQQFYSHSFVSDSTLSFSFHFKCVQFLYIDLFFDSIFAWKNLFSIKIVDWFSIVCRNNRLNKKNCFGLRSFKRERKKTKREETKKKIQLFSVRLYSRIERKRKSGCDTCFLPDLKEHFH